MRFLQRWRLRHQAAKRVAALGDGDACRHPWNEHPRGDVPHQHPTSTESYDALLSRVFGPAPQ